MSTRTRRSRMLTAILCWIPVSAVVVALFVAPSSTGGVAAGGSLTVTPGAGQYGGTRVHWEGNLSSSGEQRVWLQRRGSPTAAWADVPDSFFVDKTNAKGHFDFYFPSPAMNSVYFRVKSRAGASPQHHFTSKHQDAELDVSEANPADVPLPRGIAVNDEPYSLAVDTVHGAEKEIKPVLQGRAVTLQLREKGATWTKVADGTINANGLLSFGPYGPNAAPQVAGVYRVRLENWTKDGDRIGWFLSLPFDLTLVDRPEPLTKTGTIPHETSIDLEWVLPQVPDPERDKIEIYRTMGDGATPPTADKKYQKIADLGPNATLYTDSGLVSNRTYNYAVYTVSADGVYTRVPVRYSAKTLQQRGEG